MTYQREDTSQNVRPLLKFISANHTDKSILSLEVLDVDLVYVCIVVIVYASNASADNLDVMFAVPANCTL